MKKSTLWVLATFCFLNPSFAQDRVDGVFSVISAFGNDLYRTGELSGGSEVEWRSLEETAASEMTSALQNLQPDSSVLNEHGRTPLHEASAQGFYFLVELLLDHERASQWLNSEDNEGLTAYEHAQLALSETMLACHPEAENPFVLIPFVVKLPYYEQRRPYLRIQELLLNAGADSSLESAKELWLEGCSQSDLDVRRKVEDAADLYSTLTEVSLAISREKKLKELEERVELLRVLTQLMPASTRPTSDELEQQIKQMYRDEGFEPPLR
ncbi:ankyrin repeat domain-containing protein [uncultured Tateyamaria sp.]|uniref:ankyrin repeat domain-containing protein n=1 Tax=uncultured Tateyamaria sp. TaxID=455651 RepID=UPI002631BC44|nr:ankyrin repeat domain-containing protein [uncultured Tateyamaria sp.]